MTRNQIHGKRFEDFVKGCGLFPGSSDGGRSATASFDIEAKFDKRQGVPTSIKSTGGNIVELADARQFWAISETHRMIVGRYSQNDNRKIFAEVHEFVITNEHLVALKGDVSFEVVQDFHNGLLLNHFPVGMHGEARQWAKGRQSELLSANTSIKLHPKIDSKSQRRLQCSVSLEALIELCHVTGNYTVHTESIGDFPLPFRLISDARQFGE